MTEKMEHIGKIVERSASTTNCEKSPKETLPPKWVAALFAKFQVRYLHKWTSAIEGIEELAVSEWGEVLAGIAPEQITVGLANLDSEWPPTAQGFRDLCTCKYSTEAHRPFAPALPRPKVEPEYVESQLADMRAILDK